MTKDVFQNVFPRNKKYFQLHCESFLFRLWLEMFPIPIVIVYLNVKMHLNNKKLIFFTRLQKKYDT